MHDNVSMELEQKLCDRPQFFDIDLDHLYPLIVPGIFALINYDDKRIDIRHSHNILQSIARHATELARGTHSCKKLLADKNKIQLEILQPVEDYQSRLLSHTEWCNVFESEGYSFYRLRKALSYTVKVSIENYEARVRLHNKNNESFVVGCFPSISEAEAFVAEFYSKPLIAPVFATNSLTSGYLRSNKKIK